MIEYSCAEELATAEYSIKNMIKNGRSISQIAEELGEDEDRMQELIGKYDLGDKEDFLCFNGENLEIILSIPGNSYRNIHIAK